MEKYFDQEREEGLQQEEEVTVWLEERTVSRRGICSASHLNRGSFYEEEDSQDYDIPLIQIFGTDI